jgi:hypothetical protein
MESLVVQSLVQACAWPPGTGATLCSFWEGAFWVSFYVGIIGGVICLFLRGSETP